MAKGKGKKLYQKKYDQFFELAKTKGQEYALVTKLLGNRRVQLKCMDGKDRLGRIRGNSK